MRHLPNIFCLDLERHFNYEKRYCGIFIQYRPRQSWISNSLGTLCFIEFVLKLDIRSECFK